MFSLKHFTPSLCVVFDTCSIPIKVKVNNTAVSHDIGAGTFCVSCSSLRHFKITTGSWLGLIRRLVAKILHGKEKKKAHFGISLTRALIPQNLQYRAVCWEEPEVPELIFMPGASPSYRH